MAPAHVSNYTTSNFLTPGQRTLSLTLLTFILLLYSCAQIDDPISDAEGPFVKPYIRGQLVAQISDQQERVRLNDESEIPIPDVEVSLLANDDDSIIATVYTDLSGRYSFSEIEPGEYKICWKKVGFHTNCREEVLEMNELPFRVERLNMSIDPDFDAVIYGNVKLRSGQIRVIEPVGYINHYATVQLVDDNGNILIDTYLNNFGDYVLPLKSDSSNIRVEAVTQNLIEPRTLVADMLQLKNAHRVDITLQNDAPRLEVIPNINGERVRTAPPGETIQLDANAIDLDGDDVSLQWILAGGNGSLNQEEGSPVLWTLPSSPGLYSVYLLANDGKGGFARVPTYIRATDDGITFSGKVNATDAPSVADAEVEINGEVIMTNDDGRFRLKVPEASQYIVNITKPGYNLVSRVYLDPVSAGRWTLTRGSTFNVDPTQPIQLTDHREYQDCEGPYSSRIDWERYQEQSKPRVVDAEGRIQRVNDRRPEDLMVQRTRECGPGFSVSIPANALVDEYGNPPTNNVDITLFTVDLLAPDDMPGDFSAFDINGNPGFMESFGAGSIVITADDQEYNLSEGMEANITIPIDQGQLSAPSAEPDQIPLLRYDRSEGIWNAIGEMERVDNTYQASVNQFSEFNADLVFQDPACIQIHSPQSNTDFPGLPASYRLEITIPQSAGAAPRVFDTFIDNSVPYHTVFSLPPNTNVVMVPYSEDTQVPYGTFIVNTGGPQNPASPFRPDYPYTACNGQVTLYSVNAPPIGTDDYLHGLYSFAATNLDSLQNDDIKDLINQSTINYYNNIDPRGYRQTLDGFRDRNNYETSEIIRAIYTNSVDLGFGRDMNCVRNPATDGGDDDIACYVTNYGDETFPDEADFQDAVFQDQDSKFATVAMEYSRIENPPGDAEEYSDSERVVKFFVYGADGNLINSADLDGRGARPIPQLCLVCHGGDTGGVIDFDGPNATPGFQDRESVNLGSVFVPFDLATFTIIDGIDPAFDKSAQQAAIKKLNIDIVKATNPGIAIEAIIDEMYDSGTVDNQIEDFVVDGWNANAAQREAYREVVGKSCRICHASQPVTNIFSQDIRFHEAEDFIELGTLIPIIVCSQRVMPHALRTYNRFWGSIDPHKPAILQAFGDSEAGGYDDFCSAANLDAPISGLGFEDIGAQSYLSGSCATCHAGPKDSVTRSEACESGSTVQASLLDLTAENAFSGIVNVTAVQPTTNMNLITPGNLDQSYLYQKLINAHEAAGVGGCGDHMPPFGSPLEEEEFNLIKEWIEQGAEP